jgi:hypothetical protein
VCEFRGPAIELTILFTAKINSLHFWNHCGSRYEAICCRGMYNSATVRVGNNKPLDNLLNEYYTTQIIISPGIVQSAGPSPRRRTASSCGASPQSPTSSKKHSTHRARGGSAVRCAVLGWEGLASPCAGQSPASSARRDAYAPRSGVGTGGGTCAAEAKGAGQMALSVAACACRGANGATIITRIPHHEDDGNNMIQSDPPRPSVASCRRGWGARHSGAASDA